MPAIEKTEMDVHREGLFTRALGRPRKVNPYAPESKEHALWDEGWLSPEYDTEPEKGDREVSQVLRAISPSFLRPLPPRARRREVRS